MKKIIAAIIAILTLISVPCYSAFAEKSDTNLSDTETTQKNIYDENDENINNDELFAKYVEQLFYGEGISTYSIDSGNSVIESKCPELLKCYKRIKKEISEVANGTRTSTVFSISYEEYELLTNDDSFTFSLCLRRDCAYELYWYDNFASYNNENNVCSLTLYVAPDYSANGGKNETEVDPSRVQRAVKARDNAIAIAAEIEKNSADLPDCEKYRMVMNKVNELTDYDHDAAKDLEEGKANYHDPWAIINVFDGDPKTKVVCEGYAKSFQYLCDCMGLECYLVTGDLGFAGHMWNIVNVDGKYYYVDVTSCDTEAVGSPDKLFLLGSPNPFECNFRVEYYEGWRDIFYTVYEQQYNSFPSYVWENFSAENYQYPAETDIKINKENFPDDSFRKYILDTFDSDGNEAISRNEISKIYEINVSGTPEEPGNITSLKGIEFFTSLADLKCNYNQISSLDISKNTDLTVLHCSGNQLEDLDVSHNHGLSQLLCDNNNISSLDVSNNKNLYSFSCESNKLTSLDLSNNDSLTQLFCSNNQLKSLDLSQNTSLAGLYCSNNQLTNLDVSNNAALETLYCSDNQLTKLDISNNTNLKTLNCSSNNIHNKSDIIGLNESELDTFVSDSFSEENIGDINNDGKINNRDLTALRRYLAGMETAINPAADLNDDGKVNNRDLTKLRRMLAGLE